MSVLCNSKTLTAWKQFIVILFQLLKVRRKVVFLSTACSRVLEVRFFIILMYQHFEKQKTMLRETTTNKNWEITHAKLISLELGLYFCGCRLYHVL